MHDRALGNDLLTVENSEETKEPQNPDSIILIPSRPKNPSPKPELNTTSYYLKTLMDANTELFSATQNNLQHELNLKANIVQNTIRRTAIKNKIHKLAKSAKALHEMKAKVQNNFKDEIETLLNDAHKNLDKIKECLDDLHNLIPINDKNNYYLNSVLEKRKIRDNQLEIISNEMKNLQIKIDQFLKGGLTDRWGHLQNKIKQQQTELVQLNETMDNAEEKLVELFQQKWDASYSIFGGRKVSTHQHQLNQAFLAALFTLDSKDNYTITEGLIKSHLRQGADLECKDEKRHTPLLKAAMESPYLTNLLIHCGANTRARDKFGLNALHLLIRDHNFNKDCATAAEKLLTTLDINAQTIAGNTALHLAIKDKDEQWVSFLLKHQPNLSLTNGEEGLNALECARLYGNQTIEKMIEKEMNVLDYMAIKPSKR